MKKVVLVFLSLIIFSAILAYAESNPNICNTDSDCKVVFNDCNCKNVCTHINNNITCARACSENESDFSPINCSCFNSECSKNPSKKNTTYGLCVSEAAKARNDCYKSEKDVVKECLNNAKDNKIKQAIKECKDSAKTKASECKNNFKSAKEECNNIKHSWFEAFRYRFK